MTCFNVKFVLISQLFFPLTQAAEASEQKKKKKIIFLSNVSSLSIKKRVSMLVLASHLKHATKTACRACVGRLRAATFLPFLTSLNMLQQ